MSLWNEAKAIILPGSREAMGGRHGFRRHCRRTTTLDLPLPVSAYPPAIHGREFRLSVETRPPISRSAHDFPAVPSGPDPRRGTPRFFGWYHRGKRDYHSADTMRQFVKDAIRVAIRADQSRKTGNESSLNIARSPVRRRGAPYGNSNALRHGRWEAAAIAARKLSDARLKALAHAVVALNLLRESTGIALRLCGTIRSNCCGDLTGNCWTWCPNDTDHMSGGSKFGGHLTV